MVPREEHVGESQGGASRVPQGGARREVRGGVPGGPKRPPRLPHRQDRHVREHRPERPGVHGRAGGRSARRGRREAKPRGRRGVRRGVGATARAAVAHAQQRFTVRQELRGCAGFLRRRRGQRFKAQNSGGAQDRAAEEHAVRGRGHARVLQSAARARLHRPRHRGERGLPQRQPQGSARALRGGAGARGGCDRAQDREERGGQGASGGGTRVAVVD